MATFQDLLTFTRGSTATYWNRLGVLATAAVDESRLTHDPSTLTTSVTAIDFDALTKGDSVLIDLPGSDTFAVGKDISVTDSSNINRYLTAVVEFSNPGSVQATVKTINGTGSGSSWTLIENLGLLIEEQRTRLNTISAAPAAPENVTVTATAHTISFYGTGTVDLSGVATDTLVGTGADDRVTLTFTPSAGTLTLTPSGDVTNLQLEAGSFASSVILGEGTQVTRAADNCSRTLGDEFNNNELTIYCDVETGLPESGSKGLVVIPTAGTLNSGIGVAVDGASLIVRAGARISTNISVDAYPMPADGRIKAAVSVKGAQVITSVLGNSTSSTAAAPFDLSQFVQSLQVSGNYFLLGASPVSPRPAIHKQIVLFPRALSEQELIALTTPEA